ncbi:MAG: VWA domain-containing protein [Candidatus Acidiferrales bacterium]
MARIVRSKNSYLSTALLFLCGISTYPQTLPPQVASPSADSQSAIFVKTELVVLPVSVTDAKGNFISGLGLQNFRVYDGGRLQNITAFHEEDTPVTVGLIVDHSRSMGPKLEKVAAAVSVFAQSSNSQDEMFVVDFNDDVSVELMGGKAFTSDPKDLARAVSFVRARGRTALYDAVAEGLIHVELGHCERKALIVVSDGGDNASQQKLSQVLAEAQRSQVVIYSVGLVDADEGDQDPRVLQRLSKNTGGIAFFPMTLDGVTAVSTQIARLLREQYTLGFIPVKTGTADSFRQIKVTVAAPGHGRLHVRTRPNYFWPEQKQSSATPGKSAS